MNMAIEKRVVDCGFFEDDIYLPKEACSIDQTGKADDADSCKECCENAAGDCRNCAVQKCFKRLAEYEDIGLTPEQIGEIDKLYAEKCREVEELKKNTLTGLEMADVAASLIKLQKYQKLEAEGRLIILDEEKKEKKN